ncbi:hypothetical protein HHK36_024896 [Tetracentron sinense]|uniref:Protease Do-like PDZ domain-containing protein n=1 Tax=Tetracentron sinense TaxID=13715 RepID=A0A834YNZ1_TETSI|nr:hypothetical protein HHK36_024896 [Tetracentron sinense]
MGLKMKIKKELTTVRLTSLEEAYQLALKIEAQLRHSTLKRIGVVVGGFSTSQNAFSAPRSNYLLALVKMPKHSPNISRKSMMRSVERLQLVLRQFAQFKEGDMVMARLRPKRFSTGTYHKVHSKNVGPYHVLKRLGENAYLLELLPDVRFSPIFNIEDLTAYFGHHEETEKHGERIGFSYLVSQKYTGDNAAVKVLRNSEILEFDIRLTTHKRLIPAHIKGRPPSYYIIAGFVFTAVSVPYLRSEYGKSYELSAPVKLLVKHFHAMSQTEDEQLLVVSQVLVADINIGYEDIVNTQVLSFNGKPVKSLKSLASMVESCDDEFLKFDLDYQQIVVLQTKTAKAATLDILTTHCIPSAMSDDLKT